jgi:hypothetical protein
MGGRKKGSERKGVRSSRHRNRDRTVAQALQFDAKVSSRVEETNKQAAKFSRKGEAAQTSVATEGDRRAGHGPHRKARYDSRHLH